MSDRENESKKIFVDFYRTKQSLEYIAQYDGERAWQKLRQAINRKRQRRRIAYSTSVAAVLTISFAIFYLWRGKDAQQGKDMLANRQEIVGKGESTGVILSLPDGSQVDLSISDGQVLAGTGIVNKRESKQLIYVPRQKQEKETCSNRLEVPRGGEYHLILSDGTKVWMNSESRLEYPMTFGDSREVKLEGEAYFEVTRDTARPFLVHVDGMSVKVLGTEFNVNTHREQKVQTVLVKGKVEIEADGGQVAILKPGEMGELTGKRVEVKRVNIRKYTAWRYGEFYFENATLDEIMEELMSWYGMEAVFINQSLRERKFSGVLKRGETVQDILRKIERTTSVHFTIQNKIIKIE